MLLRPFRRRVPTVAALLVGALALTACGSSTTPTATATAGATGTDGPLSVVASTNVWASVAQAVGGDAVTATAILDDPSADPHSFEASPKVKLAMSTAALVVVNGGGYDDWAVDTVGSLDPAPRTVTAVDASGLDATVEGFNEHVFYDLDAVAAVADQIAVELGAVKPELQKTFTDNAAAFDSELATLKSEVSAAGAAHPGTSVLATEPVPGYLIADLGFTDVTPPGFSEAVEADSEVSVKDLDETKQLISSGTVKLLFDNTQTGGPVTDQLIALATSSGVGVVGVTETLPAGTTDYLSWMRATLAAVVAALG